MTLVRFLTRVFAIRFLAVLLALTTLVQLVEMLEAIRRLLGAHEGLFPILVFTALKLPLAMEKLFLLAVLIGAALTFRSLAQSNALTILRGAGLSPYRLLAALLPLTALLAVIHFIMVDRIAPAAERAFTNWWQTISPTPEDEDDAKGGLWLRSGSDIISVTRVDDNGRLLEGVTRYERNADGLVTGRIRAARAALSGGVWRLYDVDVIQVTGSTARRTHHAEMPWPTGPVAQNVMELSLPTERLSAAKARDVLTGEWSGGASTAHYRTALQKSYCAPLLPFLMVLLATPALAGGRRTGGMVRGMAVSLLLGLLFLVVNGFFTSMSEAGALPAMLAVWAAPLIFAALGGTLLLHGEE